jgi:hypothetical protein
LLNLFSVFIFPELYFESIGLFQEKLFASNHTQSVGYYRIDSIHHAFQLFLDSPLFGYGLGPQLLPSGEWQVEFTPFLFLCSFGIIPFSLLILVWISSICYLKNQSAINLDIFEIFCFASIIYYILACTNPFLLNFDYIWILIWPVLFAFKININEKKYRL